MLIKNFETKWLLGYVGNEFMCEERKNWKRFDIENLIADKRISKKFDIFRKLNNRTKPVGELIKTREKLILKS